MFRMIKHKQWVYIASVVFVLLLSFNSVAFSNEQALAPVIKLGPLFTDMYDPDYVRTVSKLNQVYANEYGIEFWLWPYEAREELSRRVEKIGNLPAGILFSRTPTKDDLSESVVADKAWTALVHKYPVAEEKKEWYEESHAITYGTKDLQTSYWWVTYLPYCTFESNRDNDSPQPQKTYTAQLDRSGNVVDVVERTLSGTATDNETDESMNPLDVLIQYLFSILRNVNKPLREWTDKEKLDYNLVHMFPHLRADTAILGIPSPEHITREDAILLARQYILQIRGISLSTLDGANVEASFYIGDNSNGRLQPASAYPLWFISFTGDQHNALGFVSISATTGAVEYEDFPSH